MGRDKDSEYEAQQERTRRRLGISMEEYARWASPEALRDVRVREMRVKTDADGDTGVLLILKGTTNEGRVIAFVGGLALPDVLIAGAKKLQAGTVRWREDRPWGE